jgi:hypothetical protein
VIRYLQRISLPAAEAHGNEIEADTLEDYVDALMGQRLASEPLLLARAAEALRRNTVTLSGDCAVEFQELGGNGRLQELADQACLTDSGRLALSLTMERLVYAMLNSVSPRTQMSALVGLAPRTGFFAAMLTANVAHGLGGRACLVQQWLRALRSRWPTLMNC